MPLFTLRNCQTVSAALAVAPSSLATGWVLAILLFGGGTALAQTSSPSAPDSGVAAPLPAAQNLLFVNPILGSDGADGSQRSPLRTITRALQMAQSGTVILLASGTYSADTGEVFPLAMQPGVTIQGDPSTQGRGIVIRGGGTFLSPTSAGQNVALLGADQAQLVGVTVTNPNPRGYGLWLESSDPVIMSNTFTGNTHDGISAVGDSAPQILSNTFNQNGANGITIFGASRPEVRENVFEKTGFGINISEQAAPVIVDNRISLNRIGVLVQENARPVLRGNTIEGNRQDGVAAIANSQPNLGTTADPGNNIFRDNGQLDINAEAATQAIPAFGNQLASDRTQGNVDLSGSVAVVSPPPASPPAAVAANVPSASSPVAAPSASAQGRSVQPAPDENQVIQASPRQQVDQPASETITELPPNIVAPPPVPTPASTTPAPVALPSPAPAPNRSRVAVAPGNRPIVTPPPVAVAPSSVPLSALSSVASSSSSSSSSSSTPIVVPPPESASNNAVNISASIPVTATAATPAIAVPPPISAVSTPTISAVATQPVTAAAIEIPVGVPASAPRSSRSTSAARPTSVAVVPSSIVSTQTFNTPIEIPVPPPESSQVPPTQVASRVPNPPRVGNTAAPPDVLRVPDGNAPLGNIGDLPTVSVARNPLARSGGGGSLASRRSDLRYRVVVNASSERVQSLVQSIVPSAFVTSIGGRSLMQVGAFSSRSNAEQAVQILNDNGLTAVIQEIE